MQKRYAIVVIIAAVFWLFVLALALTQPAHAQISKACTVILGRIVCTCSALTAQATEGFRKQAQAEAAQLPPGTALFIVNMTYQGLVRACKK